LRTEVCGTEVCSTEVCSTEVCGTEPTGVRIMSQEPGPADPERAAATAESESDRPFRYDARLAEQIETGWQDRWAAAGVFEAPNPVGPLSAGFDRVTGEKKFLLVDFFPYPSGEGLHVGHPLGYIGTDVYGRYLLMTGLNVLHPFGYDAFGLPAEQFAIDTGQQPAVSTRRNIDAMRRQLRRLGLGHDTRREIATIDPAYYRWTQWIFLKIFDSWYDERAGRARPIAELIAEFESGAREPAGAANPGGLSWAELPELDRRRVVNGFRLAYLSDELVNWCPGLGTVLANEEITADGRSDIGNYPVYRRPLRQWMLRITAYAERLLDDLERLDWPEPIKAMQREWIGPSDGALIDFAVAPLSGPERTRGEAAGTTIQVFTTRPDTLPGATYLVLAPEHPLAAELAAGSWPDGTPPAWRHAEAGGSGEVGQAGEADGGGGDGGTDGDAGQPTPADAVAGYQDAAARLSDRQRSGQQRAKTGVFTGRYVTNPMTGAPMPVFVADYVLLGYGTGSIMAVPAHDQRDLEFAREFGLPVLPVLDPPADWLRERGLLPGTTAGSWPEAFTGEGGYQVRGVPGLNLAGLDTRGGIDAAVGWLAQRGAGRAARSYRLRDWLFSRQRYWGEPFPVVYDGTGLPVALPEQMLPVRLPELTDFRPEPQADESADPVPPLSRATSWAEVELDLGDGRQRYRRELNVMPQWAGSCWYYLRYLDPGNDRRLVDPDVERYWMVPPGAEPGDGGVDLYVGGVEHAVLHLLYARFWHKVLYDLGYVSTGEPFRRLFNQGYILADAYLDARGMYVPAAEVTQQPDGRFRYRGAPVTPRAGKMGKSLKNSVSPDDVYTAYGADTLRLYEMSTGPLGASRPWQTDDIIGVHRFLQRLWRNVIDERTGQPRVSGEGLDADTAVRLHRTIATVRSDFGRLHFNTAIARLIELNAHAGRLAAVGPVPRALAEPLVLMVAPLAPHIAEEIWSRLGHPGSLAREPFPEFDPALAAEQAVTLPVQIDGRTRFRVQVPADAGEDEIRAAVTRDPEWSRQLGGTRVSRMIIVPGRIVNVVTG
jgi:leucyl-tRNA synthetase